MPASTENKPFGETLTQGQLYRSIRKQLPVVEEPWEADGLEISPTAELSGPARASEKTSDALTDDVRLLGALLGLIISEHEGADFYRFIERLRQAAKEARELSGKIGVETIHRVIQSELAQHDETAQRSILHRAVAAFRLFLLLAGIAEEYHQSERFSSTVQGEHQGLTDAVYKARQQGVSRSDMEKLLERLSARLVITAHPTKILRQTILHHQKDIFYILQAMHSPNLTAFYQQELLEALSEKIEVLWATQFSRWTKPEPREEISRVLSYLTRTLYKTLPKVHYKLNQALQYYYQADSTLPAHPMLTVGSWVGGDMDGNPYVTPEVFSDAISRQHRAIVELYAADIRRTLDKMSHALHRVGISDTLRSSILHDLEEMRQAKEDTRNYADLLEREPYRLKLTLMALKLDRTHKRNVFLAEEKKLSTPFVYTSSQALLNELELLSDSLSKQGYTRSVHVRLDRLKQTIRIFGFHFASIDLREETGHINLTAKAVLKASGIGDTANLSDALTSEILSMKVLNTEYWENSSATLPYEEKD
jgi:phosphoenolpyruvate carboxylase